MGKEYVGYVEIILNIVMNSNNVSAYKILYNLAIFVRCHSNIVDRIQ